MCGIVGVANFNKEPVDEEIMWKMTDIQGALGHPGWNRPRGTLRSALAVPTSMMKCLLSGTER